MSVTTVDLPEELVEQAKSVSGERTTRGAILTALNEMITRASQLEAVNQLAESHHLADLLNPEIAAKAAR